MPTDVVRDTLTCEGTPGTCKGALGTWQLQESPDIVGPGNNAVPVEANHKEAGWMWVST